MSFSTSFRFGLISKSDKAMYTHERSKWQYILENFLMMDLLVKRDVKRAFLASKKWQSWFIPCLLRPGNTESRMSQDEERNLFAITINMFEVLFYHVLIDNTEKGGMCQLLNDTLEALAHKCGWGVEVRMVASVLLISFLKKTKIVEMIVVQIGNSIKPFRRDLIEPCWTNLNEAFTVYDDFFFYRPCRVISKAEKLATRSFPGVHVNADGCADVPIVEQVVQLLNRDLKVHSMGNRVSGERKHAKHEKRIIDYLSTTINDDRAGKSPSLLHSIAKAMEDTTSIRIQRHGERATNKQCRTLRKSLCIGINVSKAITKLIEKKDRDVKKTKKQLIENLNSILDNILALQQKSKTHTLGRIARNLIFGNQVKTVGWKKFGQMTVKLSNLATETRRTLRRKLGHQDSPADGGLKVDSVHHSSSAAAHKRKESSSEGGGYILTDMYNYGEDQLGVQFFVPHLKEESKVKLLLDHHKRMICVKFFLEENKPSSPTGQRSRSRSRSRSTSGAKKIKTYLIRETKLGLLQKFVKMPDSVDLDKKPLLKQQANSVTILFYRR
eukprot:jgi/Bigna1/88384/estExt_fgenesh1_pg.C_310107